MMCASVTVHATAPTLDDYRAARTRMLRAFLVLLGVQGIGSLGYWSLGVIHDLGWHLADCIYMTAITVTTVGFTEVLDIESVPGGRTWTLVLVLFGISANLFVLSSITSFFVEGDFLHLRRYRRLQRQMEHLSEHHIVCGVGTTGVHVVRELATSGAKVVAVDDDEDRLSSVKLPNVVPLLGDATDDTVLEQAGIARAAGVVAALDDDKTNMFVVVSARQANPRVRIVAKAVTPSAVDKLRRAGADSVVSPNFIGGMRIASELLRPQVVRFLDEMLREDINLRIEEAVVGAEGDAVGKTIRDARLVESTGALLMAVRDTDGSIKHAPPPQLVIAKGQTLIAIGHADQVKALRKLVGADRLRNREHD